MSKKPLNTSQITSELRASRFFQPASTPLLQSGDATLEAKSAREVTRKSTSNSTPVRENPRQPSREESRAIPREYPTRDAIQEFSFRLRDSLKVKVQAEVPHEWQDELEELARQLKVKKLELYRYILGDFLGKVKRNNPT